MDDTRPQYTIGAVARRTGLSTHLLRAWEARYGVVKPERRPGGGRLYSTADVLRLRLLRQATEAGMAIRQAAQLSTEQLLETVRQGTDEPDARRGADALPAAGTARVLEAVEAMDAAAVRAELMRAAVSLGAEAFATGVAGPLLREVGALWKQGQLCPAHEHLLSAQMRQVLAWFLESLPVRASAPALVATTPPGQTHEMGALLAAVAAARQGWRVTFLGPDLPAGDTATAVRATGAAALLLSVVSTVARDSLLPHVLEVRARIPAEVAILVGGSGAEDQAEALSSGGATWLPDLEALARTLNLLAPEAGERAS